jgi:hypothetical protein
MRILLFGLLLNYRGEANFRLILWWLFLLLGEKLVDVDIGIAAFEIGKCLYAERVSEFIVTLLVVLLIEEDVAV